MDDMTDLSAGEAWPYTLVVMLTSSRPKAESGSMYFRQVLCSGEQTNHATQIHDRARDARYGFQVQAL
jgi:hypothetical protein